MSLSGADIFVSPTGNDANSGALDEPFATIARALSSSQPGDTVNLRAGTYREVVAPVRSGTAESPIIIQNYNDEAVTVSACDVVSGPWTLAGSGVYTAATGGSLPVSFWNPSSNTTNGSQLVEKGGSMVGTIANDSGQTTRSMTSANASDAWNFFTQTITWKVRGLSIASTGTTALPGANAYLWSSIMSPLTTANATSTSSYASDDAATVRFDGTGKMNLYLKKNTANNLGTSVAQVTDTTINGYDLTLGPASGGNVSYTLVVKRSTGVDTTLTGNWAISQSDWSDGGSGSTSLLQVFAQENASPTPDLTQKFTFTLGSYTVTAGGTMLLRDEFDDYDLTTVNECPSAIDAALSSGNNQIFVDGVMQHEARFPNHGTGDLLHPATANVTVWNSNNTSGKANTITSSSFSGKPDGFFVGARFRGGVGSAWAWQNAVVTASAGNVLTVDAATKSTPWWPELEESPNGTGKGFVFGLSGLLDADGEWFFAPSTSVLSLRIAGGGDPSGHLVEMKRRNWCININGLDYITVRGIKTIGGAIQLNGVGNVLADCDASHLSHFLNYTNGYHRDGGTTQGGGVVVRGSGAMVKNCTIHDTAGPGVYTTGSGHTITRNTIYNGNYAGVFTAVLALYGNSDVVTFNTIHDGGRDILQAMGTGQTILFNDLYGSAHLCKDLGIIYNANTNSLGANGRGTRIAYNWIHDNAPTDWHTAGIYLDNYDRYYQIDHNVIWNISSSGANSETAGIYLNSPADNQGIYHNTFFNCVSYNTHTYNKYPTANPDTLYWTNANQHLIYTAQNNLFLGNSTTSLENVVAYDFRPKAGDAAIDPATITGLTTWTTSNGTTGVPAGFSYSRGDWMGAFTYAETTGQGVAVAGVNDYITDGKPDSGAYERGIAPWTAGANAWEGVKMDAASGISLSGATLQGVRVSVDTTTATQVRFYYGLSDSGPAPDAWSATVDMGTAVPADVISVFRTTLTNLAPATKYYARCRATNSSGDVWGDVLSFSTLSIAPVASAVTVSGVDKVGQPLTGAYAYFDAQSDQEGGTTFRWVRSPDAVLDGGDVTVATTANYTSQEADLNNYLIFEVTPVAVSGDILTGVPVAAAALRIVPKITPLITTPVGASSILLGQTLSASTLTSAASVPGGFAWNTPSAVPAVGTALWGVIFTPTDTINYNSVALTASVTVRSTWSGNATDTNWSASANWGGTAPVAGSGLIFSGTTRSANVNNFAADTLIAAIAFTNNTTGQAFSLSGNRITLGGDITTATVASGSITDTVALAMILDGSRTITANALHHLTLSGVISESGGARSLVKNGNGTLTLSGANIFSGGLVLNAGTISVNSTAALGTGPLSLSANGTASTLTFTGGGVVGNALNWGTSGITINANQGNVTPLVFGNTGMTVGTGNKTLTLHGSSTAANDFQNLISNGGGNTTLLKNGAGSWRLSNDANSFTGQLQVLQGVLTISSLADGGVNSAAGAGTLLRLGNTGTNGTLTYTGGGVSCNRQVQIGNGNGAGGAVISNNGANGGAGLRFTSANFNSSVANTTNGSRALTLGGSNTDANTISGAIVDNSGAGAMVSLVKNDGGTWILNGNNTYTGTTTVNGGLLVFGKTAAKSSAAVTVSAAGGVGLGVGAVSGSFGETDVAALFNTNTLAGFVLNTASSVAIDTTSGNFIQTISLTAARALTKLGANTLTLTGAQGHAGPTAVLAGTLSLTSATLADASSMAINSGATLNLNFIGTDTIARLLIDGVEQYQGTWGGLHSSAAHKSSWITGNGVLQVTAGPQEIVATVTLGNLSQTYNGTAKTVSMSTIPGNLSVACTYNGDAAAPVSAGNYTVQATVTTPGYIGSNTGMLMIQKAIPLVTVPPTASAITYGQSLASSTLSGGEASVTGTFAFTTPATMPDAGTSPYSVTFTPTDSSNHTTANSMVNLTVNAAGFAAWAGRYGLSGDNAAWDADPDSDGLTNLLECAFGQNPVSDIEQYRPTVRVYQDTQPYLEITYIENLDAPYLDYTLQQSTHLNSWSPSVPLPADITRTALPSTNLQEVKVRVPVSSNTRLFLRISVAGH